VVSSTESMLAAAGVGFGTQIGDEVEGPSMWVERGVSIWVELPICSGVSLQVSKSVGKK